MNLFVRVEIEGEPASKARPRLSRSGHTYTPKGTVDAEEAIGWAIKMAMSKARVSLEEKAEFYVSVDFYTTRARRKDLDNCLKVVFDAANKILYKDDSQVHEVSARSHVKAERPRTEIEFYTV